MHSLGVLAPKLLTHFKSKNQRTLILYYITISYKQISKINASLLIRCHFSGSYFIENYDQYMNDVQFINCLINLSSYFEVKSSSNSVMFINCVVNNLYNSANATLAFNSIIKMSTSNNWHSNNLHLYNCIISNANMINGTRAYNCIQVGSGFGSVETTDCMVVDSYSDVFENWNGNFAVDADYSLKDEIATGFLGTDGTEVGIYGGMMPYDPRPSYLISYRCTVASRTTVDGKLSVDVEVVTGDQ